MQYVANAPEKICVIQVFQSPDGEIGNAVLSLSFRM